MDCNNNNFIGKSIINDKCLMPGEKSAESCCGKPYCVINNSC